MLNASEEAVPPLTVATSPQPCTLSIRRLRGGLLAVAQALEEVALARGQPGRQDDIDPCQEIAARVVGPAAPQALAPQAEEPTILRLRRDAQGQATVERRDRRLAAEDRRVE